MNLPKKPTAWGCRVCKKIDFYDDAPPSASPEHVPHRGFDIGTCKGKMIPLYSEEDLLAAQQPRVPDAGDSGAYKKRNYYGWQCPSCQQSIPFGQSHACGRGYPQYYTLPPYIDHAILERIAVALETIASRLTARAAGTKE